MTDDVKTADPANLLRTLESVTAERDAALVANEALNERVTALETELADAKSAAAKAPKVSRGASPAKPRKLGPIVDGPTSEDLRILIGAAETVEIAFSDGKAEILGIPPITVEGDAWKPSLAGIFLRDPVTINGPAQGSPPFAIDGYALILDGKATAYTKRSDPLQVGAGSTMRLADDIHFV